ncbi:MAG: hypothetical protein ACK4VO_06595 [Pseudobdellovibrio sp.]
MTKQQTLNLNKSVRNDGSNKYSVHSRSKKQRNRLRSQLALLVCFVLLSITLLVSLSKTAQASLFESNSDSLIDLARERKYKGANDEEELKVLPVIQNSEYGRKRPPEFNEGF